MAILQVGTRGGSVGWAPLRSDTWTWWPTEPPGGAPEHCVEMQVDDDRLDDPLEFLPGYVPECPIDSEFRHALYSSDVMAQQRQIYKAVQRDDQASLVAILDEQSVLPDLAMPTFVCGTLEDLCRYLRAPRCLSEVRERLFRVRAVHGGGEGAEQH